MAGVRAKSFSTPPEVTSYFDRKRLQPGFSWQDVWGEEHAYAFTVAKATETELLTIFKTSIGDALRNGQGFETWRKDVSAQLSKAGWFGPRMVKDPLGVDPDRMVDFSSPRRLKTIFWSNMNAARSAGQWERAQRTKKALPYILYVRTTSADPRPEHLLWVGIILPVDDPFWITHWPPNGWLCKCQVRQITAREAQQLLGREPKEGGVVYRNTAPDMGPDRPFRNRRTGEVTNVPAGIDPGWQTNPGLARASSLVDNLESRLVQAAPMDAAAVVREMWEDPFLRIAPRLPTATQLPAGVSERLADALAARSPVVSVSSEAIAEGLANKLAIEDFAKLPDIIGEGTALPAAAETARQIFWQEDGAIWWRAALTLSADNLLKIMALEKQAANEVRAAYERAGLAWPVSE